MNFHICCYKGVCKLLVAWQCKIQMHYNFSFLYLFVYAGLNVEVDRILEIACIITDGKLTRTKEVFPNLQVHFYVYNSIVLYLHIFSYQCLPDFCWLESSISFPSCVVVTCSLALFLLVFSTLFILLVYLYIFSVCLPLWKLFGRDIWPIAYIKPLLILYWTC